MNLNGQEIIVQQIEESITIIDICNLPSGIYFVKLTNNLTVQVGKFIKK